MAKRKDNTPDPKPEAEAVPVKTRPIVGDAPEHDFHDATNELTEAWGNFKDLWSKYGQSVLIAVCLASVIFAGMNFFRSRQTSGQERAAAAVATAVSPQAKEAVARDFSSKPAFAQRAALQAADQYLQQARDNSAVAPEGTEITLEPAEALNQASSLYQGLVDDAYHPLIAINAKLGLAAVAEARSDWDAAAGAYDQAKTQAEAENYLYLARLAETRKGFLGQLKDPIPFGVEPAPSTQPATQPDGDTPAAPTASPFDLDTIPGFESP